jgi:oligoendopeptidase F
MAFATALNATSAGAKAANATPERPANAETWNLGDLYPDLGAWETAFRTTQPQLAEIATCRGHLAEGAAVLADCLNRIHVTYRELMRLFSYTYLDRDTDLRDAAANERFSRAQTLYSQYGEALSFLDPELIGIGADTLEAWLATTPALTDYDFLIRNTMRKGAHILSPREEQILAAAADPLSAVANTYTVLTNAEITWPTIILSNGKSITLRASEYTQYRTDPNRADRKAVFDAFFGAYGQFSETLANTLSGQIKASAFTARMRGFDSSLAEALDVDAIPPAVYETLVREVNANLGTLHRYLRLHARVLGIADPHYYDLYPSPVPQQRNYPIADARELLRAAATPLGPEYAQRLTEALNHNWMHVRPAEGKRSGAYMMGSVYDVHPYLLLNHNDDFESLTTFAHEWGHAMHSLLANTTQPFAKAEYPTCIAEIASIANEVLLYNHLRATAKTPREELFYLFQELQGLRGTFFRQAQFAEFELATHREIEQGGALSGEKLSRIYGDILKRYLGQAEGVMTVDDAYAVEWAYVPHFYTEFYVYQYATSLAAAYDLMEKVQNGGAAEREAYLAILKAGGSEHPYPLLMRAGIDMAQPEVYRAVIRRCNALMDRIEKLLAEHPDLEPATVTAVSDTLTVSAK